MKKLFLATFVVVAVGAQAQSKQAKPPFIGTKSFNFVGGSCCEESITITKNGMCKIENYRLTEGGRKTKVVYKGAFKPIIMVTYDGQRKGYKIERNRIISLNKYGKPKTGCKEDPNEACSSYLD